MSSHFQRREFLKLAGAAGLAPSLGGAGKPVRMGLVGVGNRGTGLVKILLEVPGVEIPAICDINEEHLQNAQAIVEKTGRKRPEGYASGAEDYRRLVVREDLDAVITATPWELHTAIAVAAMKAGKYTATEVPAAITVEQCWELVNTSEQTGMPCMMLENDCFGRGALMALNLVEQGVLGELIHCEGGYDHDIRSGLLRNGQLSWRGMHALRRNANLYPTHPIGPIAWWTGINRGDRFTYLTSMSSKSRGLSHYAATALRSGQHLRQARVRQWRRQHQPHHDARRGDRHAQPRHPIAAALLGLRRYENTADGSATAGHGRNFLREHGEDLYRRPQPSP